MPRWTPYAAAVGFVVQQTGWIQTQLVDRPITHLREGQKIGKLHTLHFEQVSDAQSLSSRVTATKLLVKLHASEQHMDSDVQKRTRTAAIRALRKETMQLLRPRIEQLAKQHGFTYSSLGAKELKRRWGSCDSHKNITINLYLMQLDWSEIDYVLCHELTHTEHMHHGPDFWQRLTGIMPNAPTIAKKVRHTEPSLVPSQSTTAFEDDMAY
jgi:predicted metal-dependent hydrolase